MSTLRNPESGCPWDLQQDFSTIAPYTIEESYEVADAIARGDMDDLRDELGDLLFAMVNVVRLLGQDAEQTLSRANEKFERRFRAMERALLTEARGDMASLSLEELDAAWERVKRSERAGT